MLDQEQRTTIILHQEGAILANVSNCGADVACEVACCQIDGIANAMIRIQGAKDTAHFVFALSDRVAGGVRDETDFVPRFLLDKPTPKDVEPVPQPAPPRRLPDFYYGFLCGLGAMAAFTTLAMRRW